MEILTRYCCIFTRVNTLMRVIDVGFLSVCQILVCVQTVVSMVNLFRVIVLMIWKF